MVGRSSMNEWDLPGLVNMQKTIENGPSIEMVIFHSYVSLPEGI